MFEQELETLRKIIKNNTIGSAQSISLKSILESNIPNNVKSFFKGEIEWLLFQERQPENRETKFNYQQEDIRILREQTDLLLVYHYNFGQKEFHETSDKAIHFIFNFLCRPNWTMENFLFDEKSTLSNIELQIKFRHCSDYSYYWTIIERYLTTRSKTELSKTETTALLQKIDREIIRNNSALELGRMTEPFFVFVHSLQDHMTSNHPRGIPTKALSYFFEDKGIQSVSEHLLRLKEQGKTFMDYDELLSTLSNTFVKKGWYVEKESTPIPTTDALHIHASALLIPEREKIAVIKELFQNNESDYNETIERILGTQTWDDASLLLDHLFTMNDIDPYSREAIVLTNALQSYFTNQQSEP